MIWGLFASIATLLLPIWEARETLLAIITWSPVAPAAKAEYDVKPVA